VGNIFCCKHCGYKTTASLNGAENIERENIFLKMVKLPKVKDKFSSEDFTERVKTDGIYIGKESALDKRKFPERPGPQP